MWIALLMLPIRADANIHGNKFESKECSSKWRRPSIKTGWEETTRRVKSCIGRVVETTNAILMLIWVMIVNATTKLSRVWMPTFRLLTFKFGEPNREISAKTVRTPSFQDSRLPFMPVWRPSHRKMFVLFSYTETVMWFSSMHNCPFCSVLVGRRWHRECPLRNPFVSRADTFGIPLNSQVSDRVYDSSIARHPLLKAYPSMNQLWAFDPGPPQAPWLRWLWWRDFSWHR